jgi:hypothetical protein
VRIFAVLGLVFALLADTAIAQTVPSASPSKTPPRNVSGTIKSSSQEMVVVAGRDKGRDAEWTFAVEPTTDIRKGGKSIVARDLKPGDVVQVRFTEADGKAMARSIVVKAKDAPTARKAKP